MSVRKKKPVRSASRQPNKTNSLTEVMEPKSGHEESFLPTRSSLLSRLKQWDDTVGWREFFDAYGRVIHGLAVKAGLSRTEAEEVVQETMVAVARQMPGFQYDRSKGTFKGWLFTITRRSIWRQFAKRQKNLSVEILSDDDGDKLERLMAVASGLETSWDLEWQEHLFTRAFERVRRRISAKQFQ